MFKVLLVCTIEYNARFLAALPVWETQSDFTVTNIVYNGNDALECLRSRAYDMVITELNVPGIDGLQLLRKLKQENIQTLVVILSDTVKFEYIRESLMFGAFDYLKKMPAASELAALLERAEEILLPKAVRHEKQLQDRFPENEENAIVSNLINHNAQALDIFEQSFDRIYATGGKQLQNDIMMKSFYQNIINRFFERTGWMHSYVSVEYWHRLDYLRTGSLDGYKDYFLRKIGQLQDFYEYLYPAVSDKCIQEVMLYVLENPDSDLRLATVAQKVHLNYSYLSSVFSGKARIRYSDYLTRVRMSRAAFLLETTDLRIYEICDLISYQDSNYFTRQFKKIYHVAPAKYRQEKKSGISELDYSYL